MKNTCSPYKIKLGPDNKIGKQAVAQITLPQKFNVVKSASIDAEDNDIHKGKHSKPQSLTPISVLCKMGLPLFYLGLFFFLNAYVKDG